MTRVKLHGRLGDFVGKNEWRLEVCSVKEAVHAINAQSGDSIRKFFLKRENLYSTYDVLIDNKKTKKCLFNLLKDFSKITNFTDIYTIYD